MRRFRCACGQRIFFDSTRCLACGRRLGFDPVALDMVTLVESGTPSDDAGARLRATTGSEYGLCRNTVEFGNCNWVIPAPDDRAICQSCGLNEVIPNLAVPGNIGLWTKVEQSKRRLLYTLFMLGLSPGPRAGHAGLRFRFLEDQRRNPNVREDFVMTGHLEGIVTVNLAEADDTVRDAIRQQFRERYRTLLGHLRHEAGHFYFGELTRDPGDLDAVRRSFGDERIDYQAALDAYYAHGPSPDWPSRHLSAYASAHPHEDFAETFAHYLHIRDTLETAEAEGFDAEPSGRTWIARWIDLSVSLNELNRSLGAEDPYPFVLGPTVIGKLELIHHLVCRPA